MKRRALINLICSTVVGITVMIGIILVVLITDGSKTEKKKLILSSASSTAVYNGEPLSDNRWFLKDGDIDEDHTLSVNVTGVQKNVGISENHISARVLDRSGADVTEEYYSIEYLPGVLNVKPRPITVIAESCMREYRAGEDLTLDKVRWTDALSLLPTDKIEAVVEGSVKLGTVKNCIRSVKIINEDGEDVTRNYDIDPHDGTLVVFKENDIVVITKGAQKDYDGQPLKEGGWDINKDAGMLKKDHVLDVNVTGAQTDAGYSENTADILVRDQYGNDVTEEYNIILVPGELVVVQREVTVTAESAQKAYDGTPLRCNTVKIYPEHFENELGFKFTANVKGEQTEIGRSENVVLSCSAWDSEGRNITTNFKFKYVSGELEVTGAGQSTEPVSDRSPLVESYDAPVSLKVIGKQNVVLLNADTEAASMKKRSCSL